MNSVFIVFVYCIFINTSHTSRNVEGVRVQGMCTEVGLELGLLCMSGRQVKHGWKVVMCGGALLASLMYHCRTMVT